MTSDTSIAFGIRKVLQAKQNRTAMRRTIERLLENNENLREEISMLKVLSASRILVCTLTVYCAAEAKSDIDREELKQATRGEERLVRLDLTLLQQEKAKHLDEVAALKSEYSDRKKQLEIQIGLVQAPQAADSKKQSDETK